MKTREKKGKGIWVVEGLDYYSNKVKYHLPMPKKDVLKICDMLRIRIKSILFYKNSECEKYGIFPNTEIGKERYWC